MSRWRRILASRRRLIGVVVAVLALLAVGLWGDRVAGRVEASSTPSDPPTSSPPPAR
jgi:hypothetical protein